MKINTAIKAFYLTWCPAWISAAYISSINSFCSHPFFRLPKVKYFCSWNEWLFCTDQKDLHCQPSPKSSDFIWQQHLIPCMLSAWAWWFDHLFISDALCRLSFLGCSCRAQEETRMAGYFALLECVCDSSTYIRCIRMDKCWACNKK